MFSVRYESCTWCIVKHDLIQKISSLNLFQPVEQARFKIPEHCPNWDSEVNHLIWQWVAQEASQGNVPLLVKTMYLGQFALAVLWERRDATQRHKCSEPRKNITSVVLLATTQPRRIFKWIENETEAGPMQRFRPPITIPIVLCQRHLVLAWWGKTR